MGKPTGFKEIDRQDRVYAPVSDRVKNYKEFVIPLSEDEVRAQGARCMDCGIPFCHKRKISALEKPGRLNFFSLVQSKL